MPGLIVAAGAVYLDWFRRADRSLLPVGWAIVLIGLALSATAAAWRTRWQNCIALLALAIVGQACALQLINAPPYGVYQRFFLLHELLLPARLIFLLGLVLQTAIVIWSSRTLWPGLKDRVLELLTGWQIIAFGGMFLVSAVLLAKDPGHYLLELALTTWIYTINALNLVAVAARIPAEFLRGWPVIVERLDRRLPLLAALWTTVVCSIIAWFVFEGVPHIPDDVSYYIQAKYFSVGKLYLPTPPDKGAFDISHLLDDGMKWYAYGFPGWPAVLALGVLAGVPWLVNPILAGIVVLLVHALVSRLHDRPTANGVALLLAVSPWFLFLSSSMMGHTVSMVWTIAAALAVEKERSSGRGLWGTLAGIFLGMLFLTRPIEGVLVGAAIGLWALGLGGKRIGFPAITGLVLASIVVGGIDFLYNRELTGDLFYAPQLKWADEKAYGPGIDRLGFGPNIGNVGWPHLDPFPGHGLRDVIANFHMNAFASNFELFGWAFGSLGFAFLLILFRGFCRGDSIFISITVALIAGQSIYWSSGGPDFGARYWSQAVVPVIVFTVRGAMELQSRLRELGTYTEELWRVPAFIVMASFVAFINIVPWRSVGKYHDYRGMNADVRRLAQTHSFGDDSLVFVRATDPREYARAAIFNPATLDTSGTIYGLDAGPASRQKVLGHFPNRRVWFLSSGGAPNDGHLHVLAGPLTSSEAADFR